MTQEHPHPGHPYPDGTRYPADHVVAILNSRQQAERAAAALQAAGFPADDIVLLHGQEDHAKIRSHESFFTRWTRTLEPVVADAGRRFYTDALAAGKSVLLVYAADQAAVDRACDVLEHEGVYNKRAFRQWYVEDVPERLGATCPTALPETPATS